MRLDRYRRRLKAEALRKVDSAKTHWKKGAEGGDGIKRGSRKILTELLPSKVILVETRGVRRRRKGFKSGKSKKSFIKGCGGRRIVKNFKRSKKPPPRRVQADERDGAKGRSRGE